MSGIEAGVVSGEDALRQESTTVNSFCNKKVKDKQIMWVTLARDRLLHCQYL